ncbi:MAG TPA: DedA family protein [Symbiobacteriaceae bacterium]
MHWTTAVIQAYGYPGILLIVLIENLFPPIPSEIILPFAGFLVSRGVLTMPGVVIAATMGSVLGALVLYMAGRWFGRERIYLVVTRYGRILTVSERDVQRTEEWFQRYGTWTVFFCRMIPIMRSLISIPAGLVAMDVPVFTFYTTVGTLIWNILLVGIGAALGAAWPLLSTWIGYYQDAVLVVILAVLAVFAAVRLSKTRER